MNVLLGIQSLTCVASSGRCYRLVTSIFAIGCLLLGEIGSAQERESKPRSAPIATITGLVKSVAGDSIAGAVVVIASAEQGDGEPLVSKFCDDDCLKYAFTDNAGRFTIQGVNGDRILTVAVGRKGYGRNLVTRVEPRKGPLTVNLSPPRLKTIAAEENDVWGYAVDPDGKAVPGAIISPRGYMQGDTGLQGPMEGIAEATITDAEGTFRIPSTIRVTALDLEVRARGFVPQYFNDVSSGVGERILNLVRGATLRGRVVLDGQPRSGVAIGVCWVKHQSGTWFGPWETITGGDGRFVIPHVTPDQELCLYGKIDSVQDVGAIPAIHLTAADEDDLDVGDIAIVPGDRLKGRVMISDGRPLPPNLHVRANRDGPRDGTITAVLADGVFEFKSLPDEIISLSVQAIPPGQRLPQHPFPFHLSARNRSLDPHNPQVLVGKLDGDLEITILLEPGQFEFPANPETITAADIDLLRKTRIQGLPDGTTDN